MNSVLGVKQTHICSIKRQSYDCMRAEPMASHHPIKRWFHVPILQCKHIIKSSFVVGWPYRALRPVWYQTDF